MKLDMKDHSILNELKQDSRQSIRDIAKKTKLRPSTVHERIKKLVKKGVIEKFTLKLNNKAVGENFIAFMFLSSETEISSAMLNNPHIKEVFGITGEYDLLLKLKFADVEEFNEYIIKFRKQTGIKKTLTMVATVNLKEEL